MARADGPALAGGGAHRGRAAPARARPTSISWSTRVFRARGRGGPAGAGGGGAGGSGAGRDAAGPGRAAARRGRRCGQSTCWGCAALRELLAPSAAAGGGRSPRAGARPAQPRRAGRRAGAGRPRPDHGHGQGRRRQDDHRRCHGAGAGRARAEGASEHHRPGGPSGRGARGRGRGPARRPDRPGGRDRPLCREDHGDQGQGPGRGGPAPAARGPALALHRGGRGVPCLLADRRRGAHRFRRARHRTDRPHPAA